MNKFIKYSQKINVKNFPILVSQSFCPIIIKSFSSTTEASLSQESNKKINKYADSYKLSQEEIQNILKKPKKRPNVLAKTEVERADIKALYEKSVEEQIGSSRFNTVKEFNTKLELAQKLEIDVPEIKPSDRPDVKYYKYDLPIPNIDPEIQGLDDIFEREQKKRVTTNQKIWERLELSADSSFEAYQKCLQDRFKFGRLNFLIC